MNVDPEKLADAVVHRYTDWLRDGLDWNAFRRVVAEEARRQSECGTCKQLRWECMCTVTGDGRLLVRGIVKSCETGGAQ